MNHVFFCLSVLRCIDVVKSSLENDATINIIARFYSFLNESRVDDALMEQSDWKKFMDITLMLMGFPERLRKSMLSVCHFVQSTFRTYAGIMQLHFWTVFVTEFLQNIAQCKTIAECTIFGRFYQIEGDRFTLNSRELIDCHFLQRKMSCRCNDLH